MARQEGSVLSVANCGAVGESLTKNLPLFADKTVVLLFDSDHPRQYAGKEVEPAGHAATRRAAQMMLAHAAPPKDIQYLKWGGNGYDPNLPSGYDVRDMLSAAKTVPERMDALSALLGRVEPIPEEWNSTVVATGNRRVEISPRECTSWKKLVTAWTTCCR